MMKNLILCLLGVLFFSSPSMAATGGMEAAGEHFDLTSHWVGPVSLIIFIIAYAFVITEEFTHLRKSKPVMLAAGIIWGLIAWVYVQNNIPDAAQAAVRHSLLEYAELMLFLLVAMTYVNAMDERHVFEALRSWLVRKKLGFRTLFWATGGLAFIMSPVADNLTTALLMSAVVISVAGANKKFALLGCVNIVVAANAGGAFSPFGDITTLMVWQKGITATNGDVSFGTFFILLIPSLINWIVPAALMNFAMPMGKPVGKGEVVTIKRGGIGVIVLFLLTICTSVFYYNFLRLSPVIGMLTGLAYLKIFAYYLKYSGEFHPEKFKADKNIETEDLASGVPFDIFRSVARAEWDTLFFFYGVVLCVGGIGFIGYLGALSEIMYTGWGATWANIFVGVFSAIVDNIPVMFAVLTMLPDMSIGQWMLVTLTAGVGGSMLSIGSAAGVALMGQARGVYTFFGHLRWTPAIALGYVASIAAHLFINSAYF